MSRRSLGPARLLVLGLTVLLSLALAPITAVATDDITAPVLTALNVSPASGDVSFGPVVFTVTATITDDLSGVGGDSQLRFQSPSGNQLADGMFAADGGNSYTATVTIPQYAEGGTWVIQQVLLFDSVGNTRTLSAADLGALAVTFDIGGTSDITSPVLTALGVSPASGDVTAGSAAFTVTATITDDLSGLRSDSQLRFQSPSGNQIADGVFEPQAGDTFTATVTIPQYGEEGTWTVAYVLLFDLVGNTTLLYAADLGGLAVTFDITGSSDTTAPVLTALSVDPSSVDVGDGAGTVTASATITDDLAGVRSDSQLRFRSPSGNQFSDGIFEHISGSAYQAVVTIPQYAESGIWRLQYVYLADLAGNLAFTFNDSLIAQGIDVRISVSKTLSGSISAGGTLSTGTEATPENAVQSSVTSPTGGDVTLTVAPVLTNTSGYLELQMSIEAPPALASSPITIVFVIDASIIPAGQDQNSLQVFRNGTSVANCTVFDGTATPDPCVFSRELLSGGDAQGDVRLTIKTSAASTWNFAPGYAFRGFFGPVDNPPVWNTAKAGSVIPVRFSLTDYQGMEIFASGNPTSHARPCTPGTRDAIEEYVKGRSLTLTYDAGTDTYTYPWQTDKSWRGCRSLIVKLADGQSFSANFVFAK